MEPLRLHASVVVWREGGILIRGRSGAGKTTLASAFVAEGRRLGTFCRWVADDVVLLAALGGRLIARPHAAIAGRIERRGLGLRDVDHEPACVVQLAVDIVGPGADGPHRMPNPKELVATVGGVTIPRLVVASGAPMIDTMYRALDLVGTFRACS